jgi:NADH dehydrogenase FAD-containing subunit
MNTFDVLIIGGGVSGISCALVLGSAQSKPLMSNKKIGILTHQKSSYLQDAVFNNAYGIPTGTLGADLLKTSIQQLETSYPTVIQIPNQKVIAVHGDGASPHFEVITNKEHFSAKIIVVCIGSNNTFAIDGLMQYVIPHQKSSADKNRIQLQNNDHWVSNGIYVAGTLAGHRSQLPIAAGSGAAVATDILTLFNDGVQTHSHDSISKN